MKVLIRQSSDGCELKSLKDTLESLEKYGFKRIYLSSSDNVKDDNFDLDIKCGETISCLRQDKKIIHNYGGFKVLHSFGSSIGFEIIPSSNSTLPEIISKFKSAEESVLTSLVNEYPKTFETHYQLGFYYFNNKNFTKAYTEFRQARKYKDTINWNIGYVKEWREHGLDLNQGLSAYYSGAIDRGRLCMDRIIMNKNTSALLLSQCYKNYEFFTQPLKTIWTKEYTLNSYNLPKHIKKYKSLNPSLLRKNDKEIYLNIRIVNWSVNPVGFNKYTSPHPKNKFKTKNLLSIIDNNGDFLVKPSLVKKGENFDLGKIRKYHIDGFEDCRLFYHKDDEVYFITNYTKNNPKGAMRLSIGKINIKKDPKYVKLIPLQGYGDHLIQKNWLVYCVEKKKAFAIYGYDPMVKIQIDLETGIVNPISETKLPVRSGEFRGSGGPIPFEDGYLIVIHQVYLKDHGGRRYFHRFVHLDKSMIPIGLSHMWYLKSKDIEYVSTMMDVGDNILIGYGMCDKCACISLVSKEIISSMILPICDYM